MTTCRGSLTIGRNVKVLCTLDDTHSGRGFNHYAHGVSFWGNKILHISDTSDLMKVLNELVMVRGKVFKI